MITIDLADSMCEFFCQVRFKVMTINLELFF